MMEAGPQEGNEGAEKNSTITVKFWLPQNKEGKGEYIGEVYIEDGVFVAKGASDEDTEWLNKKLGNIWVPQRGIPTFRKVNDQFEKDKENRLIIDTFKNHMNTPPDELLKALYEYASAMGVFRVNLEPKT